jgi:hypothetical protein
MDRHVTAVGVIFIACGAMGILIGLFLFWLLAGIGLASGEKEAMGVMTIIATALGGLLVVTSIPEIIAGIGLLKQKEWARILALILSALSLLEIPIGTIIGIYGFWVLLNQETVRLFNQPSAHASGIGVS